MLVSRVLLNHQRVLCVPACNTKEVVGRFRTKRYLESSKAISGALRGCDARRCCRAYWGRMALCNLFGDYLSACMNASAEVCLLGSTWWNIG